MHPQLLTIIIRVAARVLSYCFVGPICMVKDNSIPYGMMKYQTLADFFG